MDAVLLDWPFFALAVGVAMLAVLLIARRPAGGPSRWRDPAWLVCLVLPVYMIHQFEEHGVDLLGRRYQFIVEMCRVLGHPDLASCPADREFIFAVNVGAVWIAGLTAIVWRHRNPMVGACAYGIILVNGFLHVVPGGLVRWTYNPGLLTSAVLFLPLSAYALWALRRADLLDARRVLAVVASGVVLHVILIAGLLAYGRSLISHTTDLAIQIANGFVPLAFGVLVQSRSDSSRDGAMQSATTRPRRS